MIAGDQCQWGGRPWGIVHTRPRSVSGTNGLPHRGREFTLTAKDGLEPRSAVVWCWTIGHQSGQVPPASAALHPDGPDEWPVPLLRCHTCEAAAGNRCAEGCATGLVGRVR